MMSMLRRLPYLPGRDEDWFKGLNIDAQEPLPAFSFIR